MMALAIVGAFTLLLLGGIAAFYVPFIVGTLVNGHMELGAIGAGLTCGAVGLALYIIGLIYWMFSSGIVRITA